MKKTISLILTVLCALAMCIGLAACGGGDSVAGDYELVSVKVGSTEYKAGEKLSSDLGGYSVQTNSVTAKVTAESGGKKGAFTCTRSLGSGRVNTAGTWKEESGVITFSGDTFTYALNDDGNLVVTDKKFMQGETFTYTLKKV